MKKVELDFHHEEFDELSDRSIRQFMRKVATAVRLAQLRETTDFIFAQELDYAEKRSISDRLANASREAPAYYVERIEKGSLTAIFTMSTLVLLALLHKPIVGLVDDRERRRALLKNLRRYVKRDWAARVAEAIAEELTGRELGSHVVAERIRIKEKASKVVVDVKLTTEEREDGSATPRTKTRDAVERIIEQRLDDLRRDRRK